MNKQKPNWQPISMLPVFTQMIDGMLEASTEQLQNMRLVIDKPHILDDATLSNMIKQYQQQIDDNWLYEEQFKRWQQEDLVSEEIEEIGRLTIASINLKKTNEAILKIVKSIENKTIDKILAMNEIELIETLINESNEA